MLIGISYLVFPKILILFPSLYILSDLLHYLFDIYLFIIDLKCIQGEHPYSHAPSAGDLKDSSISSLRLYLKGELLVSPTISFDLMGINRYRKQATEENLYLLNI